MSDTPRTDALKPAGAFHHWTTDQLFAHSRQLERELNAANATLAKCSRVVDLLDKVNEDQTEIDAALSSSLHEAIAHTMLDKTEEDLSAATAELAATKEQLRVAREAMELARGGLDLGEYSAADETLANAIFAITVFTQPNLSADSPEGGNPAKGKGGVPSTFPA